MGLKHHHRNLKFLTNFFRGFFLALPNDVRFCIVKKMKYIDVFNFSIVCKRFYLLVRSHKDFVDKMRISKHISSYDCDFFIFCWKNWLNLVVIFQMLSNLSFAKMSMFFPPVFFCRCGSRAAGKCRYCTRLFVDSVEMGSKIDHYFTIRVSPLYVSTINNLVRQVKANAVILNLYYSFFNYLKSENLGEIFEEVANNSFGLLVYFKYISGFILTN